MPQVKRPDKKNPGPVGGQNPGQGAEGRWAGKLLRRLLNYMFQLRSSIIVLKTIWIPSTMSVSRTAQSFSRIAASSVVAGKVISAVTARPFELTQPLARTRTSTPQLIT